MRTIQFRDLNDTRRVGIVRDTETIDVLVGEQTLYDLALEAIREKRSLARVLSDKTVDRYVAYQELIAERRVLPPLDHPDAAHTYVTGTGLTHLGSADARDRMHRERALADEGGLADKGALADEGGLANKQGSAHDESPADEEALTDSMRMFHMGLEGGKPAPNTIGVQPEWFYKGDGSIVVAPYRPLMSPSFGLNGGEEPEIVGLYVIGLDGTPYRLGFALGNEFSDHVMERQNYLYLAHSKLRPCAFGPELRLGSLPEDVRGMSRILRGDEVIWERPFLSGERNMSHTIANLEFHHFKYRQFRRPGDVHVHFFGTATLSFTEGMMLASGDEMEIEADGFGRPLRNTFAISVQPGVNVSML